MSESSKAVFLSYASQDADAATRICESLRSAGIEVWFDLDELVGGDAWDQKIRRQIKECALFIPVISANTQARSEGYFRLEWRLADHRTHLMAKGRPFLVPVVIDETRDADAQVPDSFVEVQWSRLRGGETPPAFAQRVKTLLSGESPRRTHEVLAASAPVPRPDPPPARKRFVPAAIGGGVLAALMLGAFVFWWQGRARTPSAEPGGKTETSSTVTASPARLSAGRQLAEQAYQLTQKLNFTREDLASAEGLAKEATDREPRTARTWAVRAWVQASYVMRNWDYSPQRFQATQTFANQALALQPDEPEALNSLCEVLEKQRAPVEVERLARQAAKIDPKNFRSLSLLGRALMMQNRVDEARAVLRDAIPIDPTSVLGHYELALAYTGFGYGHQPESPDELATALKELDASLAPRPFAAALMVKAVLLAGWRGDLAGMRLQLDQLEKMPLPERAGGRAVFIAMMGGLLERKSSRVFAAAALTAETYFDDRIVASPKAWGTALAYRLDHKENSAQQEWRVAEQVLRQRLVTAPQDPLLNAQLAITLAWQGRDEEATQIMRPLELAWSEKLDAFSSNWLARFYAARGDATQAAPFLKHALNQNTFLTDHLLPLDPWWDKLRGQPEFDALLKPSDEGNAAAAGPKASGSTEPKDPRLRKVVQILDSSDTVVADLGVAEDLVKEVLNAHSTDVEATLIMGRVQTYYLLRGFDRSEERFALAKQSADRGLLLAPDDPEAMTTLGLYLRTRGIELPRAAKLFRQAIAARPDEPRYYRMLDNALAVTAGISDDEVIASALRTANRFPKDALVQYELARHYRDAGQLEPTLRYLDLAITEGPVVNAIIARAYIKLAVLGDRSELDQLDEALPERYRGTTRAVYAQFIRACASGRFDLGLDALLRLPEPWIIDFDYTGPTSLLTGELYFMRGKPELAQLKFAEAQAELSRHHVDLTRNFSTAWLEPWLLMRRGKIPEARARNAVVFGELTRPFRVDLGTNWWFNPIPFNLLVGEREKALALIREAANLPYGPPVIRQAIKMDPRMAPWRDDVEIQQLLSGPSPAKTTTP
jgi:tetratricopeptide (TPR) repeat protein